MSQKRRNNKKSFCGNKTTCVLKEPHSSKTFDTEKSKITFDRVANEWFLLSKQRLKRSTYQRYLCTYAKHIKGTFGKMPVEKIDVMRLYDFAVQKLKEGLSPGTVNNILIIIHVCLKHSHRLYKTPMIDMIYMKAPYKEMRVLSREEQNRLTKYLYANTDIYKLGVLLSLNTGIRIGELCALTWNDISDGCININKTMQRLPKKRGKGSEVVVDSAKTNSSIRKIPIPSFLLEEIEMYRSANQSNHFLSSKHKTIVEPRTLQYRVKRYYKSCEIENATFHTLRHTFATRAVESGFDIKTLSQILGHRNVEVTLNKYVHTSDEQKRKNMDKMQKFF